MAFLIIIAVIIFFSWRFIVAVVGGAIEFSIFVIRHIQVILPLLLFSWAWFRFGLLLAALFTLLFLIVCYVAVINIVGVRSNKMVPNSNSFIVQTEEQNKLIRAVKAVRTKDD